MNKQPNWKKDAALFLSSQTISLFGSSLVSYAISWYVSSKRAPALMTVSILCGFLPTFVLSPFGGVWADRADRKLLIALSDLFSAMFTLALAVVFMTGYRALWLIFLADAARAAAAAVQMPAVGAFLAAIVPKESFCASTPSTAACSPR